MLNKYSRTARVYPAVLCAVPIFILNYFLIQNYAAGFLNSLVAIKWVGGITISLAFTYLLAQAARFIGKELYEKSLFNDELNMPTTNILLHSDQTYSAQYKSNIHGKIYADFGMQVCSVVEEKRNNNHARKIIVDCVSMIRGKVKDGRLLLQHNIEYGFIRNLIGGSFIATYISILNLYIFGFFYKNDLAFYISLITAVIYFLLMILGKYIISRYGIRYAKVIIQEYLLA